MLSDKMKELYGELIKEHGKSPRNFGVLAVPPAIEGLGINPSCGDKLVLFLQKDGDTIANIKHNSEGCAIFRASCSLMSAHLIGKTTVEAEKILDIYIELITLDDTFPSSADLSLLGKLEIFTNIRQYPARVKCAALFARTLQNLLRGEASLISTEE